jgi:hypothetical protein
LLRAQSASTAGPRVYAVKMLNADGSRDEASNDPLWIVGYGR